MPWIKNRGKYFVTLLFCHSLITLLWYGCFSSHFWNLPDHLKNETSLKVFSNKTTRKLYNLRILEQKIIGIIRVVHTLLAFLCKLD